MDTPDTKTGRSARDTEPIGKAALIASVGGTRGYADWTNPGHRLRRLLSEFIGMAGLTFVLSGCAAILVRYGGRALQPWQTVLVLSVVSALWLVVAVGRGEAEESRGRETAHIGNAATRGHVPCMLSGMPGRAVRDHGDQPGAVVMLRVFCPSCCR
jgi:hypothetical protein